MIEGAFAKQSMTGSRLSPQQAWLWKRGALGDGMPFRAISVVVVDGEVDLNELKRAMEDVVRRHEILRTTFQCTLDGDPVQIVAADDIEWREDHDWGRLSLLQQESLIDALFEESRQWKLGPGQGPALQVSTAVLGPAKYGLFISLPSLCADASTLQLLMNELCSCYENERTLARHDDPPMQYADVAEWLNELLESEETAAGRDYWFGQSVEEQTEIKLPWEPDESTASEFAPRTFSSLIAERLRADLAEAAGRSETTEEIMMLACWQTLLRRLCGKQEVVVYAAYDGRDHQELKSALGPLTRFLPLRARLPENIPFIEALEQIKSRANEIYAWQQYFTGKRMDLQPGGGYAFEHQESPTRVANNGVRFSTFRQSVSGEPFKIKLTCRSTEQSLAVELHYDQRLFDSAAVECLAQQYQALLQNVVEDIRTEIGGLNLLNEAARRELLIDWNRTSRIDDRETSVQELFEAQALRTPEEIALTFEEETLTYHELNLRANRLAHFLRARWNEPETPVGIYMERAPELIIGILGILKAGCVYVPLDPESPPERLAFLLEDAGIRMVLTQQWLVKGLSADSRPRVCLDTEWESLSGYSGENPPGRVSPENLAYMIYTSGSTGWPKGVMLTHQGLSNLIQAQIRIFDVRPASKVLQFAPLSFDASVSEIFISLLAGATLSLDMSNHMALGTALAELLSEQEITHLTIPPSILATLPTHGLKRLETIIVAGEACSAELAHRWAQGRRFLNAYGPTEGTVCATAYVVKDGKRQLPIGRPIDNTQIYVLDSRLEPVPVGVAGELFIGGLGTARGYLNRPDITAERFLPNPFSSERGSRLYRTGDLAMYLPGGDLQFIGRVDYQVKIHGIRIEPGEIEAVLARSTFVEDCLVAVAKDAAGHERLVAYIISEPGKTPRSSELREYLKMRLPRYMIPSAFLSLKEWPLTSNGKVDRKALPPIEIGRHEFEVEYLAPRTPVERTLVELWERLLAVKRVGIDDNFFELGGHSLLAATMASHIREAFGVALPLRRLFESPTIHGLAESVEAILKASSNPSSQS